MSGWFQPGRQPLLPGARRRASQLSTRAFGGLRAALAWLVAHPLSLLWLLLLVVVVRSLVPRANEFILDPIDVPDSLQKAGYTPRVAAQRIRDQMRAIERRVVSGFPRRPLAAERETPDITIPGSSLSTASFVRIARDLLGVAEHRISGEAVAEAGRVRLRIRSSLGGPPRAVAVDCGQGPCGEQQLDTLWFLGARELLKIVDPYLLAVETYHVERIASPAPRFAETLALIRLCLANANPGDDAWAHLLWGNTLWHQGRRHEARQQYQRALALSPGLGDAHDNLILLAFDSAQGDLARGRELAQREYEVALAQRPLLERVRGTLGRSRFYTVHETWADVLADSGDRAAAVRVYETAAALAPRRDVSARVKKARLLVRLGDAEAALGVLDVARELNPEDAELHGVWGDALVALGRHEEAAQAHSLAAEILPSETNWRRLAASLAMAGRSDEAQEALRRADEARGPLAYR